LAINIVHAVQGSDRFWGVLVPGGITGLQTRFAGTAALIAGGAAEWRAAVSRTPDVRLANVKLLSPVTAPCRVVCQGSNYRQHMIESGLDPDEKTFNMSFEKSDASSRRRWARSCGPRMCASWITKSSRVW
jgi:2-keto-4-pentenoate hydratase/2-oxohepta-3-ene-1,7-dioic acid hydratase in catechol pathway